VVLLGVSNLRPVGKEEAQENTKGERNGCLLFAQPGQATIIYVDFTITIFNYALRNAERH
jgi:hypothetical protein